MPTCPENWVGDLQGMGSPFHLLVLEIFYNFFSRVERTRKRVLRIARDIEGLMLVCFGLPACGESTAACCQGFPEGFREFIA